MKQKLLTLCCLLLMSVTVANAQYKGLDTKRLAEILSKEKKTGIVDDSVFVIYLDSLGFKKSEQVDNRYRRGSALSFYKKAKNRNKEFDIIVRLITRDDDDTIGHSIDIKAEDNGTWWWMIIQLKKFGMKVTEGDGEFMDLKGKGLFAGTGHCSLTIGCSINKK